MDEVTHLLDTHTLIWAQGNPAELGARARAIIQTAPRKSLAISDFTLLEIAMLTNKGRLEFSLPLADYLDQVEQDLVILPLRAAEAAIAFALKLPHSDPFDRVIVATAQCRKIPLLTRDRQMIKADLVETIW